MRIICLSLVLLTSQCASAAAARTSLVQVSLTPDVVRPCNVVSAVIEPTLTFNGPDEIRTHLTATLDGKILPLKQLGDLWITQMGPFPPASPHTFAISVTIKNLTQIDALQHEIEKLNRDIRTLEDLITHETDRALKAKLERDLKSDSAEKDALMLRLKDQTQALGTDDIPIRVQPLIPPTAGNLNLARDTTDPSQNIEVLSSDSDPQGCSLTVTSVTQPSRGQVAINSNGTITYTPNSALKFRTVRVSTGPNGANPGDDSGSPQISENGRSVMFTSDGAILSTALSGNGYVYDILTGRITQTTVSSNGSPLTNLDGTPAWAVNSGISSSGQYVSFYSPATNLTNSPNEGLNTFVRDVVNGTTWLASERIDGLPANDLENAVLSADGLHVLYASAATNLVSGPTLLHVQTYLRDTVAQTNSMVSVDSSGNPGDQDSTGDISVSADGRYSFFSSKADNLVTGDTNGKIDCFRHDLMAGETIRTSVGPNGIQSDADCDFTDNSDDGRYATFQANSKVLASDANGVVSQIYLRDISGGTTTRLISSSTGGELLASVDDYSLSPDLRYVGFSSKASNVLTQGLPAQSNCFLLDRTLGQTIAVNVGTDGSPLLGPCTEISTASDGAAVAVTISGSNLAPNDPHENIFLITKTDQFTYTISDGQGGTAAGIVTLSEPMFGP